VLTGNKLHTFHANCILGLDHPARGKQAAVLIEQLNGEFTRRATEKSVGGFVPLLGCVGYNVRWHGFEKAERRRVIDWILTSDLPQINDPTFMASWGRPETRTRFKCLYRTIALYIRKFGSGQFAEVAAARWRTDLSYIAEKAEEIKRHNPEW